MIIRNVTKWLCLGAFLCFGGYAAISAESAVAGFLPEVQTVALQKATYCRTVNGGGNIIRTPSDWRVSITVNESDIRHVRTGQKAALHGAAFDNGVYVASVVEIADTARISGTYATVVDVVLKIENPDENLRSGYTAQADIEIGEPREILVVPYEAVEQDDEGEFVYVVGKKSEISSDGDKESVITSASRRGIVTGAELSGGAEVISGLTEADEVIIPPEEAARVDINGIKLVKLIN